MDIVVNKYIGIELKLHYGGKDVTTRLYRQFTDYYHNPYKKIIAFVINHSNQENSIIEKEIKNLIKNTTIPKQDYAIVVKKV